MKTKTVLAACILLINFSLFSQTNATVPKVVDQAFKKMFKNAKEAIWSQEKNTEWEVKFSFNGLDYSATFKNDGSWLETEYLIDIEDLPRIIKQTLSKTYSDYEIETAEISETPLGKKYELRIVVNEESYLVHIDDKGKLLKEEVLEVDDDIDNDDDDN